ncbi:aspartate 1-decarboxylase [Thermodesulfatator indicus DSM 15286]|uniref:Aspartate 1-decarboxylase n=1 Tax=Thermodesulfatator indicus (strain DSM 15286 / JCM 11887 / CIR29812) TaxID=667014 RepID=F8A9Y0_THEID|nr:aspartate 1-decarboxylase [Thermodesulfatator indicus]AEH44181.1 aspartate 1-decarboxylase [Thermodesulfatator indicus DSM 15286]
MWRKFLRSKLHTVRVTAKNLEYEGSLTLDPRFMIAAGLEPFESIWVYNLENGERFETYVIKGEWGSKEVCLNGAAARKGEVGDRLIVVSYHWLRPEEIERASVRLVYVDNDNNILQEKDLPVKE